MPFLDPETEGMIPVIPDIAERVARVGEFIGCVAGARPGECAANWRWGHPCCQLRNQLEIQGVLDMIRAQRAYRSQAAGDKGNSW